MRPENQADEALNWACWYETSQRSATKVLFGAQQFIFLMWPRSTEMHCLIILDGASLIWSKIKDVVPISDSVCSVAVPFEIVWLSGKHSCCPWVFKSWSHSCFRWTKLDTSGKQKRINRKQNLYNASPWDSTTDGWNLSKRKKLFVVSLDYVVHFLVYGFIVHMCECI